MKKKVLRYLMYALLGFMGVVGLVYGVIELLTIPKVGLQPLLPEDELERPTHVVEMPDDPDKMLILEQKGKIKWFTKSSNKIQGIVLDYTDTVFGDSNEDGLLGLEFHKEFLDNGYIYITYNMINPKRWVFARMTMDYDEMTIDPSTQKILIMEEKPRHDHNGGDIKYGPDGYLYLSNGESNESKNAHDLTTIFGTIMRIDVSDPDSEKGYSIPVDNPFVDREDGTRKEIWAYGLRNPWRFAWDPNNQDMYVGDVGNFTWEEINKVVKGGDYGWPAVDGDECNEIPDCNLEDYIAPVGLYHHRWIRVIIGGYVYRGSNFPQLRGKYIFGDFWRGIYSMETDKEETITFPNVLLHEPPSSHPKFAGKRVLIASFYEDQEGELYVVDLRGSIHKMVPLRD